MDDSQAAACSSAASGPLEGLGDRARSPDITRRAGRGRGWRLVDAGQATMAGVDQTTSESERSEARRQLRSRATPAKRDDFLRRWH